MSETQDKLYKYHFHEDVKRILAETFVKIQQNKLPFSFDELQDLAHKKAKIETIVEAFILLKNKNISLDKQQLLSLNLKKTNVLELVESYIDLQKNKENITPAQLEKLAQANINLKQLSGALSKLKKIDPDITISDLKNYNIAAVDINRVAEMLTILKQINKYMSLKEMLMYKLSVSQIQGIIKASREVKSNNFRVTINSLISHVLDGGDALQIITAKKLANQADIDLSYKTAAAINLAGKNTIEAVKEAIQPKILDIVPIKAITNDGDRIAMEVKLSLRVNLKKYLLGTNEHMAVAKVKESIISHTGKYKNYIQVVSHFDEISANAHKSILADKHFTSNSSFDILTISITDAELIPEKTKKDSSKGRGHHESKHHGEEHH